MRITSSGESSLLLLNIIKFLDKLKIPYAIVGAFAASFYGWVRASLDCDAVISIARREEKLDQLLSSLRNEGLRVELRRGDRTDPIKGVINIEDKFRNRVDLLMGIRGMKKDIYGRVITASFMKRSIKIVSVEDFIAMKIYAGSGKDIQDVLGVLKVYRKRINLPLLKEATLQYGKQEFAKLKKMLSQVKK